MDLVVLVGAVETVENTHQSKVLPHIWHFWKPSGYIFGMNQKSFTRVFVHN